VAAFHQAHDLSIHPNPQEHGKSAMPVGGALDFAKPYRLDRQMGGDIPFSTLFGAGENSTSSFTIDAPTTPPPSYWIGLSRPPPAPNWQRFAIERVRTRPPSAPNWRTLTRPPPAPNWQSHQEFLLQIPSTLPPSPPISNLGSLDSILSPFHRHVASPGQTCANLQSSLLASFPVFLQRKCIGQISHLDMDLELLDFILLFYGLLQISFLLSTLRHFRNGAKVFKKPFNSKIPLDASMALVVEGEKSLPQLRTTTTVTGTSFWRVTRARKSIAMTILNGKVL
jgi:hypothetical protein